MWISRFFVRIVEINTSLTLRRKNPVSILSYSTGDLNMSKKTTIENFMTALQNSMRENGYQQSMLIQAMNNPGAIDEIAKSLYIDSLQSMNHGFKPYYCDLGSFKRKAKENVDALAGKINQRLRDLLTKMIKQLDDEAHRQTQEKYPSLEASFRIYPVNIDRYGETIGHIIPNEYFRGKCQPLWITFLTNPERLLPKGITVYAVGKMLEGDENEVVAIKWDGNRLRTVSKKEKIPKDSYYLHVDLIFKD